MLQSKAVQHLAPGQPSLWFQTPRGFQNCITQQFCDVLHNTSLAFEDEGENETEYHHEG